MMTQPMDKRHKADILREEGSGFSRHMQYHYVRVEEGEAEVEMTMTEHAHNVVGGLHGGASFGMIDCAMGAAVYSLLADDELAGTLEAKTNYIRPVREGKVTCVARVIHRGRRTAVVDAELTAGGKLIAKASGTFAIWKNGE